VQAQPRVLAILTSLSKLRSKAPLKENFCLANWSLAIDFLTLRTGLFFYFMNFFSFETL
jgi:hypothetical protein